MTEPRHMLNLPLGPLEAFYAISFCYFASHGALAVLVPLYTRQLGLSYGEIGTVAGSFWLGTALVKLIAGRHSDIVGRRSYLGGTLVLAALSKPLYLFARSPLQFAALMAVDGVARGVYSVVRAPLITELSDDEHRGRAFGLESAAGSIGMGMGNFAAGMAMYLAGAPPVFCVLSAVLAASAAAALKVMPISKGVNGRPTPPSNLLRIPGRVWNLVAVNVLQSAVLFPLGSLVVPFYLTDSLGYSAAVLGALFAVENLVGSPIQATGGYLADRTNAARLFAITVLAALLPLWVIPVCQGLVAFLVFYTLHTLFMQLSFPVLEVVESMTIRKESLGFDYSIISVSVSLGAIAGNLTIGRVIDLWGPRFGFPTAALGFLMMVAVFMSGFHRWRR